MIIVLQFQFFFVIIVCSTTIFLDCGVPKFPIAVTGAISLSLLIYNWMQLNQ
jgi:hypothetical protein